jgi:hypothetical protein
MLGHCAPYPKVGNVVMVKINNHMNPHSFSIVVVRNISKPIFILDLPKEYSIKMRIITTREFLEQDDFVREVELGMLQVVAKLLNALKIYKLSGIVNTNS